jgi:hypothetical protein
MTVPVLADALVRWQHAAGPFWPYVCAAPFLGTGDGERLALEARGRATSPPRRSRQQEALADRLLSGEETLTPDPSPCARERGAGGGLAGRLPLSHGRERGPGSEGLPTVLLVDLPAEPVLALAPLLAERGWYPVPVVQRWIATPAVLPCRRLIERLLLGAWQVRRPASPRGAVLIADGERTGPTGTVTGRTFDNRYEYQICRFPSTDFLLGQGVEQVRWITDGTRPIDRPVRPDLAPYLETLLQAGIAVEVTPWAG